MIQIDVLLILLGAAVAVFRCERLWVYGPRRLLGLRGPRDSVVACLVWVLICDQPWPHAAHELLQEMVDHHDHRCAALLSDLCCLSVALEGVPPHYLLLSNLSRGSAAKSFEYAKRLRLCDGSVFVFCWDVYIEF